MIYKKYVVQDATKGSDNWTDSYQILYKLEFDILEEARRALETVRFEAKDWRLILRLEIVL